MSDEPMTMGQLEKKMSRMMKGLAKSEDVKEVSNVLSRRTDKATEKVTEVSGRLDNVEDDMKNFKDNIEGDILQLTSSAAYTAAAPHPQSAERQKQH